MTKVRQTRQITIETHSITIIRTKGVQFSTYCEHCRETVSSFAPEQIAAVLQLDLTEICRRVEAKQIHLTNDGDSMAMICVNSLGGTQTKYLSE
jgi:hypothetical protein